MRRRNITMLNAKAKPSTSAMYQDDDARQPTHVAQKQLNKTKGANPPKEEIETVPDAITKISMNARNELKRF